MEQITDFIMNGQAHGDVAHILLANGMDVNALRPFIGQDGGNYRTVIKNGKASVVRVNTTATLRRDDWIAIDDAAVKVARERLQAVSDLIAAGLTFSIPNGFGKTVLETETQSDINDASISMDANRDNANDRPEWEPTNLPLPITHKDFSFSSRQLAASRNGGSPLDTTMAEEAARKVSESNEKLLLGRISSYAYGGGTIYGYTNFPSRLTRTITAPTAAGWTGATLLNELLAARVQLQAAFHFGPYLLYVAPAWDQYIDNDFKAASDKTLRNRIAEVSNFSTPKTLDFLQNNDILMIQMTTNVIREVIGMPLTTVQWPTNGGLTLNFKVMNIMVPQLRADQNDNTGILHASS